MTTLELPPSWRGRAIVIRDVVPARDEFTAEELAIVDGLKLEKRREEWMRARLAAKELKKLGDAWIHVSLSHSGPYAAAAIGMTPVGVDVQVVRDVRESAAHFFLTDDEEAAMQRCTIEDRMLHFWCAKEAAWKQRYGTIPGVKLDETMTLRVTVIAGTGVAFATIVEPGGDSEFIAAIPTQPQ